MSARCTAEAVSWLRLELYHLGELSEAERRQIHEHLAVCWACQECLSLIEQDCRALPPLPVPRVEKEPRWWRWWPRRWPRPAWPQLSRPWAMPAALATGLAMLFLLTAVLREGDRQEIPRQSIIHKGGELSLILLRERRKDVVENPRSYAEGDRFQLLLTYPGPEPVHWEVLLFQGEEIHFPYESSAPLRCGNRVPLPGAFSLTGSEPTVICVVVGEEIPNRERLTEMSPDELPEAAVCVQVFGER